MLKVSNIEKGLADLQGPFFMKWLFIPISDFPLSFIVV